MIEGSKLAVSEQAKLETSEKRFSERTKRDHAVFFKTSFEELQKVLELVEYGKRLPDIYLDRQEEEWNRKISRITHIKKEEVPQIMRVISSILYGLREKTFIPRRTSELKKIGFSGTEIRKFLNVATLLKKHKGAAEASKILQWKALSEEVLPGLSFVECAFDFRCGMKNGRMETFIPMVLLKLRTLGERDSASKDLVFQMRVGDLRVFVEGVTEMYRNVTALRKYTVQLKEDE